MRLLTVLALVSATACTHTVTPPPQSPALVTQPAPEKPAEAKPTAPRNFVCERFAHYNPKVVCTPEYTDAGEHLAHTARVVIDQQLLVCTVTAMSPSAICVDPVLFKLLPPAPTEDAPEKGKKPAKKK